MQPARPTLRTLRDDLKVPLPSARRFWKFGRSLRRAIQSYPEDIKVAIAGTGGLSHQVHGERNGFNNTEWDMEFMDRLVSHPEGLLDYPIHELARLGGWEGAEAGRRQLRVAWVAGLAAYIVVWTGLVILACVPGMGIGGD